MRNTKKKTNLLNKVKSIMSHSSFLAIGLVVALGVGVLAYSGGTPSVVIEHVDTLHMSAGSASDLVGGVYETNKQYFYSGFEAEGALSLDKGNVVVNESSGSYDFRVESNGQTDMLLVDGSADKVGLASTTPFAQLSVGAGGSTTSTISAGRFCMYAGEEDGTALYVYMSSNAEDGEVFATSTTSCF